jgi:hypothetical protein
LLGGRWRRPTRDCKAAGQQHVVGFAGIHAYGPSGQCFPYIHCFEQWLPA